MWLWVLFGFWCGALGLPELAHSECGAELSAASELRIAAAGVGFFLVALGSATSIYGRTRLSWRWAKVSGLRGLGLFLLACGLRSQPDLRILDVPRSAEAWFWSEGKGVIRDSLGLRIRCADTLDADFAYRLRVDLEVLEPSLAPWSHDAAAAGAAKGVVAKARLRARLGRVPICRPWWERVAAKGRYRLRQLPWGPAARGLVQALWLGDLEDLPESVRHAFQNLGLSHVLAVSGFHLGLLWGVFYLAQRAVPPQARGMWTLISLAGLWSFVAVVGFSASSVRAATMLTVGSIIQLMARRPKAMDSFAIAQIILLAWDPRMAFQLGFRLSSAAVFGLLLVGSEGIGEGVVAQPIKNTFLSSRLGRYLREGVTVSLAAQWATLPLSLHAFHVMPWLFLASNLLMVPLLLLLYPYSALALLGLPLPDPEPLLAVLSSIGSVDSLVLADRYPRANDLLLLVVFALGGLWGMRRARPVVVVAALVATLAVLLQIGPSSASEQRWISVGRGLACVQVRADTAQVYGTKYLIENEFIWNQKLNPYFKSLGVRHVARHVRPYRQLLEARTNP